MHSAFYYLTVTASAIFVVGSIITVVAMVNAPEGFEGEDGFIGLTRGDEQLLNEFAAFRQQALAHVGHGGMAA